MLKHTLSAETPLATAQRPSAFKRIRKDWMIYVLILPALILTFVFQYLPMPGILMAFKDYDMFAGILKSPWAGLKYIREIFNLPMLYESILNTLKISFLQLLVGFPAPIILALLINELRDGAFKRVAQSVSYLPHFLSWISVVGLVYVLLGTYGPVNDLRVALFGPDTQRVMWLSRQDLFIPLVLGISIWKEVGWGTVVHLAAISSIDMQLYEAARMDGAGRLKQTWYITLPTMLPTVMILLIFQLGHLFKSNFDLIYGLQNPYVQFEVISTIVYQTGIKQGNYSMATAVGFMEGLVAFILTFGANRLSKKISEVSIW